MNTPCIETFNILIQYLKITSQLYNYDGVFQIDIARVVFGKNRQILQGLTSLL